MTHLSAIRPITKNTDDAVSRQINMLVTEKERSEVERVAKLEMRSLSSASRMLILRGIQQYDADTTTAE